MEFSKSLSQISDVDLRLLRVFRAVVECRGFAAAEQRLGIARSTISTHMSDLETRFGLRLCERGRGGFSLTDQGEQVYQATLHLLQSLEAYRSEIADISGDISGPLEIGMVDTLLGDPKNKLTQCLAELADHYPGIHPSLHHFSPDELEQRLLDGRLHLAIMPGHRELPDLSYEALYDEANSLYVGRGHPMFGHQGSLDPAEDLKGYVAHGYLEPGRLRTVRTSDRPRPGPARATAFNMEGMAMLILSGRYAGYLPDHYAQTWIEAGSLHSIDDPAYRFHTRIMLATRQGQRHAAALRVFRDILLKTMRPLPI